MRPQAEGTPGPGLTMLAARLVVAIDVEGFGLGVDVRQEVADGRADEDVVAGLDAIAGELEGPIDAT